jgi:hypothetical protein
VLLVSDGNAINAGEAMWNPERCVRCGRLGAAKIVEDRGADGFDGRLIQTIYLCRPCEDAAERMRRREERGDTAARPGE